jgi:hypothetical protein
MFVAPFIAVSCTDTTHIPMPNTLSHKIPMKKHIVKELPNWIKLAGLEWGQRTFLGELEIASIPETGLCPYSFKDKDSLDVSRLR